MYDVNPFVLGYVPDPAFLSNGETFKSLRLQPLMSSVLRAISVDSRFGSVPRGSVPSYQCLPVLTRKPINHPDACTLPMEGAKFVSNMHFVPNCDQVFHLENLKGNPRAVNTDRGRYSHNSHACLSQHLLWKDMRQPSVAAGRFDEVCHV